MVRLALAAARDGGRGLRVRGKALVWVSELAQAHTHTHTHVRAWTQALTFAHSSHTLTQATCTRKDRALGWRKG